MVWVEEVCNVLRRSHPSLISEVEKMLDEFARRFKPEPEEELLNAVHALIVKMFKTPAMVLDLVPPLLQATIERVCKKFFVAELIPSITQRKHIAFVQKYKAAFEADFLPVHAAPVLVDGVATGATHAVPSPRFPSTLTQLIHRLKRWKAHLQFVVGTGAHVDLQLEKLSPYLSKFHSWDIEIPPVSTSTTASRTTSSTCCCSASRRASACTTHTDSATDASACCRTTAARTISWSSTRSRTSPAATSG